jgi:membrane fusion protein, heavy metal efflux system
MKRLLRILPCLALLMACSKDDDPEQHHDHGEAHEEEHDHAESPAAEAPAAAGSVRVERAMLRDLRVTLQAAESRPASETVTVLGELWVNEDAYAEVGSPIPARVQRVLAAPGDDVQSGQSLAELSSPDVGKARAELRAAQARQLVFRQTFERRQALAGDAIVSGRELDAARAELAQAEAEARAARETLEALGASTGQGSIFSLKTPIAGTVIERNALLGRLLDAQRPAFVVGELSRLWLIVHAFERDALRMRINTTARVSFSALPAAPASGTVTRIGNRVNAASRSVDVRIEIDNPKRVLRPGMSASALVPLGDATENVVAVPVEALQRTPDGWCVFLPTPEEGVFAIRPVGRGRDLGAEVEVLSGLTAGERVVKDGAFLLKAEADKARGGGAEHHH